MTRSRVDTVTAARAGSGLHRSERRRQFTEQLVERRLPTDIRRSPDGSRVAFTVERMDEGGTASSVWISSVEGPPRRVPTPDGASASVPRWSPDGHRLAIAIQQPDSPLEASIVVMDESADHPLQISVLAGHPEDILWAGDGKRLTVLCATPGADSVVTAGAVRYTPPGRRNRPTITRPGSGQRRAYEISATGSRPRNLGPRAGSLWDAGLCPNGTLAVIWSADASESGWYDSIVGVLNTQTGQVRAVYRPEWQLSPLAVAPTGDRIAVIEGWSSDRGRVCGDIRVVDLTTGSVDQVAWFGVDIVTVQWRTANSLWFAGWRGMSAVWGWVGLDGTPGLVQEDDITPGSVAFPVLDPPEGAARAWAAGLPRDGSAGEVVVTDLSDPAAGVWSPVTRLSRRHITEFGHMVTHQVQWEATDGLRIDGLLAVATAAARPSPLVIYAHGGPANLWSSAIPLEVRFLVDAGFAVLLANPRGSVGRGQEFARANLGDAGGGEMTDLIGGIDACAAVAGVDTTRVGIVGGSYGGYLSACAAAMTDRIACAVMMYGHPDLLSARYGSNNPAFYDKLMMGQPTSATAQAYVLRSPIIHVTPATAPMLLLHGAEDRCSPLGQAEEMYRALIDNQVDTELVVYPGEGHGLHSVAARGDCWTRAVDWLNRYLVGGPK